MTIGIISVRQPYADCIVQGFKDVENRSRPTRYRGLVAILSSKKVFDDDRAREAARRCFGDCGHNEKTHPFRRGGIIGIAELYDVVTERAGDWWFTGPFGYLLRHARAIPFIPCRGYQTAVVACPPDIEIEILKHLPVRSDLDDLSTPASDPA